MEQLIRRLGWMACFMWLCLGMVAGASAATADKGAGVVMNVEGALSAKGADGELRSLATWAKVFAGDTLFTGKDSFARVKFSDGGQVSLRPDSQFLIEGYNHEEQEPKKDEAKFNLLKGGMRAISGLIGKRGDPDSYGVKTQTATVGIRGTKFGVLFCKGDCTDIPLPTDGKPLENGTHLEVLEGQIVVKNAAGSQLLNAGQFGFVASVNTPPIVVPPDRGVKVDIPAKLMIDKVRGGSDGENEGAGDDIGAVEDGKEPEPLVCPI
jgi:hypothetical protein